MLHIGSPKSIIHARGLLAAGVIVFSGWGAVILGVQCLSDCRLLAKAYLSTPAARQPPHKSVSGAPPGISMSPYDAVPAGTASVICTFDEKRAMEHVRVLSQTIGHRFGGSDGEKHAAQYIGSVFSQYGYDVRWQTPIRIPETGLVTQNVIATKHADVPLDDSRTILIGGHYDSINRGGGSPGANDNASGIGVMLEMARVLREVTLPYRVEFVAYGAEERQGTRFEHHHYGSRYHAAAYFANSADSEIIGMLCVDMVAVGQTLYVRNMKCSDDMLIRKAQWSAERLGFDLQFKLDHSGCSDHEPYEKRGIPVAWFERLPDPDTHTRGDQYENLDPAHMRTVGRLYLHMLMELSADELDYLADASPSPQ